MIDGYSEIWGWGLVPIPWPQSPISSLDKHKGEIVCLI